MHGRQGIAQIMGDTGRYLTDGGQARGADEFIPQRAEFFLYMFLLVLLPFKPTDEFLPVLGRIDLIARIGRYFLQKIPIRLRIVGNQDLCHDSVVL